MRAVPVDPRDQQWEDDSPAYRVFFWTDDSSCDEWQLTETDIDGVLAWADEHANGRTMSIWAVRQDAEGVGLIRLAGIDPTADPATWPSWASRRS